MKKSLTLLALSLPQILFAVVHQNSVVAAATQMDGIVKIFGALLIVVAVIFVAGYVLRKTSALGQSGGHVIQVLASNVLGPKERLVLVQCGTQQLLLGMTSHNINTLHCFDGIAYEPTGQKIKRDLSSKIKKKLDGLGMNSGE